MPRVYTGSPDYHAPNPANGEKNCIRCGSRYPVSPEHFQRAAGRKDGFRETCKTCAAEIRKERREAAKASGTLKYDPEEIERFRKEMIVKGIEKKCSTCQQTFPYSPEFFTANQEKRDGFSARCRDCDRAYKAKWARENPEVGLAWVAANREKVDETKRRWYEKNGAAYREANKERNYASTFLWREKNREWTRQYSREYTAAHKEQVAETYRRWAENNRDKVLTNANNRRARLMKAPGSYTAEEWAAREEEFGHRCLCCGKHVSEVGALDRDHIIPLTWQGEQFGSNFIWNHMPLCPTCNNKKYNSAIINHAVTYEALQRHIDEEYITQEDADLFVSMMRTIDPEGEEAMERMLENTSPSE